MLSREWWDLAAYSVAYEGHINHAPDKLPPEVVNALDRLTYTERQVVRYLFGYGWTTKMLADEMGTTQENVRMHKHNAIKKLKRFCNGV